MFFILHRGKSVKYISVPTFHYLSGILLECLLIIYQLSGFWEFLARLMEEVHVIIAVPTNAQSLLGFRLGKTQT